ncbi:hypothetical protein LCL97_11440 [Seohaeicola saemankumensis]|nr:hypothetical protein [Seohaeicola saemankumensis]MCA0871442.1 hypothetical protein [Seohaeicola saemankumensis]
MMSHNFREESTRVAMRTLTWLALVLAAGPIAFPASAQFLTDATNETAPTAPLDPEQLEGTWMASQVNESGNQQPPVVWVIELEDNYPILTRAPGTNLHGRDPESRGLILSNGLVIFPQSHRTLEGALIGRFDANNGILTLVFSSNELQDWKRGNKQLKLFQLER